MKIEWDKDTERLYETGVKNCVLYKRNNSGAYVDGTAWNGITGITESPEGAEPTDLWADDIKYLTLRSTETLNASIEAYMYPEEFEECDGTASLTSGVAIGQQSRKTFGLCYRTTLGNDTEMNDYGYKLHLLYGCSASPSEKAYNTINDSPEAITFSWEVTTTPVAVSGFKPTANVTIDSTKVDATKLASFEEIIYGTNDTYSPTSDVTPTVSKTYYVKNGDTYTEFTGESFESDVTYYEKTEGTSARLPLPGEIMTFFSTTQGGN